MSAHLLTNMNNGSMGFECQRCRATRIFYPPCSIDLFLIAARDFIDRHRDCQAPNRSMVMEAETLVESAYRAAQQHAENCSKCRALNVFGLFSGYGCAAGQNYGEQHYVAQQRVRDLKIHAIDEPLSPTPVMLRPQAD